MNISGKSADFPCGCSGQELENVSANQGPGKPPLIWIASKTYNTSSQPPRRTTVVRLKTGHEVVQKKKLKMWKVYDILKDRQMEAFWSEKISWAKNKRRKKSPLVLFNVKYFAYWTPSLARVWDYL